MNESPCSFFSNANGCRSIISIFFFLYLVSSLSMRYPQSTEEILFSFVYFILLGLFIYLILPKSSVGCCLRMSFSGTRRLLIKVLVVVSLFSFLLNCIVIYYSLSLFRDLGVSATEYKNGGVADELLKSVVPYNILFFARVLSPFGYLCLVFLLAFFERLSLLVVFLLLLGTFNIFLVHLHVFSRSMLVVYLIAVPALFVYYRIYDRVKFHYGSARYLRLFVLIILLPLGAAFMYLSIDRFEAMTTWWRYVEYDGPFGPVLFSIFHYISSSYQVLFYLLGNDILPPVIGGGAEFFSIFNERFDLQLSVFDFGEASSLFKSVVVALVYDLGVLGFSVFLVVFFLIEIVVRSLFRVVFVVFSLFFVSAFFFGNVFVYEYFWLGILYSLFFSFSFFAGYRDVKREEF